MNYKEVIESKYNREAWQQLLHDIFLNDVSFWKAPYEVKVNGRLAKSALNLPKVELITLITSLGVCLQKLDVINKFLYPIFRL